MTPDQHRLLGKIVFEAEELSGAARDEYIASACGGDETLRAAVCGILAAGDDPGPVLRLPPGASDAIHASAAPQQIGPYRVRRRIAEGGMGAVYEAEEDTPRRRVAIKVVRAGFSSTTLARRFKREIELLGRLQHPGIAQLYAAGVAFVGGTDAPYFVMEFIDGVSLSEYVGRARCEIADRLQLVAQVCDAVQYAHQHGVIHRDLKPGNILVVESTSGPLPKILDFGIARAIHADEDSPVTMHTEVGQIMGTLPYMSPEQLAGRSGDVDTRADVYALGVVLYELLADRLPHDIRACPLAEAARIVAHDPPTRLGLVNPALRGDIEVIVGKALEQDKERRYASASELAADIRRCLNNEPIAARPATLIYQLRKFARRNRGLVSGVFAAVLILIVGSITTFVAMLQAHHNADMAQRSELAGRRATYRMSIAAAAAVAATDPITARQHLDAAPPELRNWEWRHEGALLEPYTTFVAADRGDAPETNVAFDASGRPRVALSRNGSIEIINLVSGDTIGKMPAARTHPAMSGDGARVATWRESERRVELWDIGNGSKLAEFPYAEEVQLFCLALNRDGTRVAASGAGGTTIWDAVTGTICTRTGPAFPDTRRVVFSGDNRAIISALDSKLQSALAVYSPFGAQIVARILPEDCRALALTADEREVAVGTYNRQLQVFDLATLEQRGAVAGHADMVTGAAFSADGLRLASSSRDGTCRVFESGTDHLLALAASGELHALAFSPDGKSLAVAGSNGVGWWEWNRSADRVFHGHNAFVYHAVFSLDQRWIASFGWDNRVRIWNTQSGECVRSISFEGKPLGLDFTSDGTRLVVDNGGLHLVDFATGRIITAPSIPGDRERCAILFAPYAADSPEYEHVLRYFRVVRGGAHSTGVSEGGQRLSSALDGSRIAIGEADGRVRIVSRADLHEIRVMQPFQQRPHALALSPDGKLVAISGDDGVIDMWNADSGAHVAALAGHLSRVYSISFSPDGTRLVSGGNDNTIRLWDMASFEQVAELHGHESYVHSVCFSPDGTMLVSASGDGTVRVWDSVPRSVRKHEP